MAGSPPRKTGLRLREAGITAVCYILGWVFALPGVRLAKPHKRALQVLSAPKIVLIKPCCLGDVMLSTPTIASLHASLPTAYLSYAVSQWARPVIVHNPRLDEILDTGFVGSHFTWRSYLALVQKLRQGHYDAALVLDRSPMLALLPWLAGIKVRAGLNSLGRGFALNYRANVRPGQPRHEAEVYLDVVRSLGIKPVAPRLEFFPGEAASQNILIKAQQWHLDLSKPLVVIHPGGGQNPDTAVRAKRWPAANFAVIAGRLLEKGVQVVLIGAEGDREAVTTILADLDTTKLVDASSHLDIAEIGALFKYTTLFVGNDTGLMHIAAAETAVVAIFGPSSPTMYRPYNSKGAALSPIGQTIPTGLPLAEYQALSVEQGGISSVTVDDVWAAIETILSSK